MISDVVAQWCTQGDLLAVAGMEKLSQLAELSGASFLKSALVKFYNVHGEHIYTLETPVQVQFVLTRDHNTALQISTSQKKKKLLKYSSVSGHHRFVVIFFAALFSVNFKFSYYH